MEFKTNINCSGCIAKVTPLMDQVAGKEGWQVDTTRPDKLLTVTNGQLSAAIVIETIKKAGFQIEPA